MSFSFDLAIDPGVEVDGQAVLGDWLGKGLRGAEEVLAESDWPDGSVMLYLEGRSTRGVVVTRNQRDMRVRLHASASIQDHELGVSIVLALMEQAGAKTTPEDSRSSVSPAFIRRAYGRDWATRQSMSGVMSLVHIVQTRGQTVTVPGPVRRWMVDGELLGRIQRGGPASQLYDRILDDIRRLQYSDFGDVVEPQQIRTEQGTTLVSFFPRVRHLLPKSDIVVLLSGPGMPPMLIDWEDFESSVRFEPVDAGQLIVEAPDQEGWAKLLMMARPNS